MAPAVTQQRATRRLGVVSPSIDDVRAWLGGLAPGTVRSTPISREIVADVETPVSAYLKIAGDRPAFMLESIEGGERLARYSFIGAGPMLDVTMNDGVLTIDRGGEITTEHFSDPLAALGDLLGTFKSQPAPGQQLPRFTGGAVGYLAYESIRYFEPRVQVAKGPGLQLPDGRFMIVDTLLVFDHIARTIRIISHLHLDEGASLSEAYQRAVERIDRVEAKLRGPLPEMPVGGEPVDVPPAERRKPNTTADRYHEMVRIAKEYIAAGDIFQVVPSQRVDLPTPAHPFTIYRALRMVNPSPYMIYLDFIDHQVIAASPELLVRLEDGVVTNHPIAGTRPRGENEAIDEALAIELAADPKERAEHIMLVDLGRNDVGRVSKPGSVRVPQLMEVERYSHVMHLVTHVEGDLAPGLTGLDALRSCFPAGTVSGAPKVRAMEIIGELETDRRGVYSGAIGYVDFSGGMDTAIALRTMVYRDGVASLQAGGGVVADSVEETEYAETYHKMRALLRAIELAEQLEASEQARQTGAGEELGR
jgi:anthranilate synthase component 1